MRQVNAAVGVLTKSTLVTEVIVRIKSNVSSQCRNGRVYQVHSSDKTIVTLYRQMVQVNAAVSVHKNHPL